MRLLVSSALVLFCAAPLVAQSPDIIGFSSAAAARQRALETTLQQAPAPRYAQRHARVLAKEPHVAGTAAQTRTADYVLDRMAHWGLDTARVRFSVYLPLPDSTRVELVDGRRRVPLRLDEPVLREDSTSQVGIFPAMNGYSGRGDATAAVVYANYGLPDDFRVLDSLGVDVKGKVVIARYGRSFRGIKVREAEKAGAAGLLLYSDPADDGYVRGDTYSLGPYRHPDAPQRGSVYNGYGDPSTPGWASTRDAHRLPLDSMTVARIPVVPIGYRNAERILRLLRGPDIPQQGWQGGLPFRYHVGGTDAAVVRVAVFPEQGAKAYKTIENTIGILRGRELPDEWVITGAHRDAWGPGAVDNVSGTVTVLESAFAWSRAAKAGQGPRRTLVFATWDAEEWGLVGSSEWVELMADSLRAKAVAYLNQDVTASGRAFGESGTASLQPFVRDATRAVEQPGGTASVYDAWRAAQRTAEGAEPPMGDLGGGSDFAGFYNHLGIASFDFGFGGPGGVYHSAYDSWSFMERFGDPGYLSHAQAAKLNAVLLARLANAEILPFDFAYFADYLSAPVERLRKAADAAGLPIDTSPLESALAELRDAGVAFNAERDRVLASDRDAARFTAANRTLRTTEQAFVRATGLRGRPWLGNLVFAADRDNGYANIALPGIAEALRDADAARARSEVEDLASRVQEAARRVRAARAQLTE